MVLLKEVWFMAVFHSITPPAPFTSRVDEGIRVRVTSLSPQLLALKSARR